MDLKCNGTKFTALFGDITELDADVFTLASSPDLLMNGGIALKIKDKGGQEIEDEAVGKGKGEPGQVIITDCGCLPAKKVYHCVLLNDEKVADPEDLRKCVRFTLERASEEGYKKIAFPALGSAFKGLSPKLSTDIIVSECKRAAEENMGFEEFIFVVCDQTPYRYYKKALKSQLKQ
ncbi:MAG TPA: macro domain-containing protein [Candidatus Methanofastidiosa archaeon]|nr:macro domain-containing protein [Candidatus Methanofastidiosa archaeon]HPR41865.1 macro domain-containing protein [Candidatus Methanofastidiosa archaeon]